MARTPSSSLPPQLRAAGRLEDDTHGHCMHASVEIFDFHSSRMFVDCFVFCMRHDEGCRSLQRIQIPHIGVVPVHVFMSVSDAESMSARARRAILMLG